MFLKLSRFIVKCKWLQNDCVCLKTKRIEMLKSEGTKLLKQNMGVQM